VSQQPEQQIYLSRALGVPSLVFAFSVHMQHCEERSELIHGRSSSILLLIFSVVRTAEQQD
jgi:hypothetical protein